MAELATERLVLRPVAREDIPRIVALAGDARVAERTGNVPHPLSRPQVEAWMATLTLSPDAPGEHAFAIDRKEDNEFLGVVSLVRSKDEPSAELGYWVGVPHWGQGYASEAVRRIARAAFGEFGLKRIGAHVFTDNERSVGVLIKAGFDVEGRTTRPAPARGGDREVLVFQATRASFARAALGQAVGRE